MPKTYKAQVDGVTRIIPPTVAILVVKNGKVSVSYRLKAKKLVGFWQFAGGKMEPNEDPLVAAWRELKEETGLVLHRSRFTKLDQDVRSWKYPYVGHTYVVHLRKDEEPANPEPDKHTDWSWVTPKEARTIGLIPGTELYLEQVFTE